MVKLEINEKKYEIPESFDEMTLEQYCKVFFNLPKTSDENDEVQNYRILKESEATILSRILGEDDDFCLSLQLPVYARLAEKVKFLYEYDDFIKNASAGVTIDGKRYSIPPLDKMPLRQFIDADMVMKEAETDEQYIDLLSVLLTTHDDEHEWLPYDGNYEKMIPKVKELKCSEALPLVYHFFKKNLAYKTLSQAYMNQTEEENQQPLPTQDS